MRVTSCLGRRWQNIPSTLGPNGQRWTRRWDNGLHSCVREGERTRERRNYGPFHSFSENKTWSSQAPLCHSLKGSLPRPCAHSRWTETFLAGLLRNYGHHLPLFTPLPLLLLIPLSSESIWLQTTVVQTG